MPDFGSHAVEIERSLEASLAIYPPPDYGSTLLAGGLPLHSPSGGRKLNGGIMMRAGYRGPTVNIRPPKWKDNTFWIRAENYPDAQYIADAVYYHTGRGPFHFANTNFQYPPLRLGTREFVTREMCSAYVESIAKGADQQKQREVYKDCVKDLVLKAVKSPEAVLFLSSLRPVAWPGTNLVVPRDTEIIDNGLEEESQLVGVPAEEAAGNDAGDEGPEQGTSMEVDDISEQAIQLLVLSPSDAPAKLESMLDLAYVACFGIGGFESQETILRSDWQGLGAAWSHLGKEEEEQTSSNLKELVVALDKREEELWRSTKKSDWVPFRPQPNISYHTLRYIRELPSPFSDCEAL